MSNPLTPQGVWITFTERESLYLTLYWITCLLLAFLLLHAIGNRKFKVIILRKIFHFLSILLFVPPIILDWGLDLFVISSVLVLVLMLSLEAFRVLYPKSQIAGFLTKFFRPFLDHKDKSSRFITSHIELLLACTGPLIVSRLTGSSFLSQIHLLLSGSATVGIGDSFAAIVGLSASRPHKIMNTGKTIEGTAGFFFSVLLFNAITGNRPCVAATLAAALTEVFVKNHDNVAIPVAFIVTSYLVE